MRRRTSTNSTRERTHMGQPPRHSPVPPKMPAAMATNAEPAQPREQVRDRAASAATLRNGRKAGTRGMFRIIRYFSIASLVCILVAAVALAAFFRHIAIREIVEFGESGNVALAEAALNAVRPELLDFLARSGKVNPADLSRLELSPAMAHEIDDLMRVKSVARLKIYNNEGFVVYATRKESIGRNQRDNVGFIGAMEGNVASKLVYRDAFNVFDRATESDNLIQTYVPILDAPGEGVRGVFELYADVNAMVEDTEQAQWQIVAGAVLIMVLLYVALLMVVRYAERIIMRQQQEIRDHTAALERISARMLNSQEDEKKKIAFDLHEGVAQTLAAVKMSVEHAARQLSGRGKADASSLQPMVQAVKDAISEVRAVALNLRPSSLDELGLLATIEWFCRELSRMHPEIETRHEFMVNEADLPQPLKIIIYRVLEETCHALHRFPGISRMHVALVADEETISLSVDHDRTSEPSVVDDSDSILAAARERTLLSGGSFDVHGNAWGGRTVRAIWLR